MPVASNSAFQPGMVIYQIYPRSFKDTNDDGVGDLRGIIEKLDYIKDLGVNAIWINPIQKSPMLDFGYDVADYYIIDPLFGTVDDYEELLDHAHRQGIQVIMDLVFNHTSDKHPWFVESRSSRDNSKRDWYVWKDPSPDGSPPNNWRAMFGGSAWEFDKATQQYYLHSYLKQQPDLNWANPAVRSALKNVMRFWLDKGVDGFRMDAVYWYSKDPEFRNDAPNPDYRPQTDSEYDELKHIHSKLGPHLYEYLNELIEVLGLYDDRFMVTEISPHHYTHTATDYTDIYKKTNPSHLAPFNFMLLRVPWDAKQIQSIIDGFQSVMLPDYTPIYVFGNHDQPRLASRIDPQALAAAALLLLALPGVSVIYYGEELGMEDADISKTQVQDTWEVNVPGLGKGRDPQRTPMQWSEDTYAGFSKAEPWLPINANYLRLNVQQQLADPGSLLNFYKRMLAFRASSEIIKQGTYEPLVLEAENVLGFIRHYQGERLGVVINFSAKPESINVAGKVVISTCNGDVDSTMLGPNEGRVIQLP